MFRKVVRGQSSLARSKVAEPNLSSVVWCGGQDDKTIFSQAAGERWNDFSEFQEDQRRLL